MATARAVVKDAYVIAGLAEQDQGPDGGQYVAGLRALNDMMSGWELGGPEHQFSEMTLNDDVLVPRHWLEGTKYSLAMRLCIEAGYPFSAEKADIAKTHLRVMRAERMKYDGLMKTDSALDARYFSSNRTRSGYNIDNG